MESQRWLQTVRRIELAFTSFINNNQKDMKEAASEGSVVPARPADRRQPPRRNAGREFWYFGGPKYRERSLDPSLRWDDILSEVLHVHSRACIQFRMKVAASGKAKL